MAYKFKRKHKYPFFKGHREFFKIKDFVWCSDWGEENFILSTAYAAQGKIKLFSWQEFPLNITYYFERTIDIAPVQTGKSLLGEIKCAYKMDTDNQNMMFIYSKKDTIQDVFDERIKPLVKEIPAIRKYWSGAEDDLTRKRIKLSHLIARVASAGIKSDIASFNAGVIYGSEIAKWPKKDFDQVRAAKGRQQASRMLGKTTFTHYETSPEHDQDPSYIIAHTPGTIFFKPVYPCPNCGKYQLIHDRKIREIPNTKGEKDHSPERIRNEKAAYLECEFCTFAIKDEHRLEMSFKVKWASVDPKNHFDILEIYNQSGKDLPPFKNRYAVCNWNRLVDVTWTFYECLATYFEALNSPNTEALKTYVNEDMADWVKLKAKKFSDSFLDSKRLKYFSYGEKAIVPDGVSVLLLGMDTQDNGFYYIVRGYGIGLESWLVRCGFIHCKKEDYTNPRDVYNIVYKEIYSQPFKKQNGDTLPILWGFIDRGGHRSIDVDYIVDYFGNLGAYIGSTSKVAPLIEQKKSGIYFGHTERLSRIVAANIESKLWHLPLDVPRQYKNQVLNQYDEEYVDSRGNNRKRWMTGETLGKPDHYRDCENLIIAACNHLKLDEYLFDRTNVQNIENQTKLIKNPDQKPVENKPGNMISDFKKELGDMGW